MLQKPWKTELGAWLIFRAFPWHQIILLLKLQRPLQNSGYGVVLESGKERNCNLATWVKLRLWLGVVEWPSYI